MRNVLVEKNRFLKNENLIMRIVLEGCESAIIRRNSFIRNNQIEQQGTLAIYVSPQVTYSFTVSFIFFFYTQIHSFFFSS